MAPPLPKTWTIERLRLAVLTLAGALLLAIIGFVVYGRWRLRHVAQDLPSRLGISIQQTTRGYVLSKTEQGRTIFTLHAARAIQFKSGKRVSLRNVEIDLYNRSGGPPDTISGDDFEFNPSSDIVTSRGETHIVLYPPANAAAPTKEKGQNQPVRVVTNGLVFSQKTGVATCTGEVDFQVAESSGQAIGALYDSKQARLTLQSQVTMTTVAQNHPAVLHASHAVYERNANQVHLLDARYSSVQPKGTETAQAKKATVTLRRDGSAQFLEAAGDVHLSSADGASVQSAAMTADFGPRSQPRQMHFSGDVRFAQNQAAQQTEGSSQQAQIQFNEKGRATRSVFDGSVRFQQRMTATAAPLKRTLTSDHLDLHLRPSATTDQSQLQSAQAVGDAVFASETKQAGKAPQMTTLAAQTLKAKFGAGNQLQHVDGIGQTRVRTIAANGDINTSTGDLLTVDFAPSPPATGKKIAATSTIPSGRTGENSPIAVQSIETAVQTGNVVLRQVANTRNHSGRSAIDTAYGSRAEFSAANDTVTLTGNPKFRNDQLEMTAEKIQVKRASGNAIFSGMVQSTLEPAGQSAPNPGHAAEVQSAGGPFADSREPAHIIAEQATLLHDQQKAVFSGRARLWQGADSVEAPVIELSQKMQTLAAYGDPPCSNCVFSTFVGNPVQKAATATKGEVADRNPASAFRIRSSRLLYSDAERKADFTGGVRIVSSDEVLFSNEAEVLLTDARTPSARAAPNGQRGPENPMPLAAGSGQSSVRKIIASGNVRLMQPGRRATGSRLVYTAGNGHFVLTGNATGPPRIFDADRGTVTGEILTFTSPGQAIIVTGNSHEVATTRTRVKKS